MEMTRRDKRAARERKFILAKEAVSAAQAAGLDYKGTNESGALRIYSHSLNWHLANRPNITATTSERKLDRSRPLIRITPQ